MLLALFVPTLFSPEDNSLGRVNLFSGTLTIYSSGQTRTVERSAPLTIDSKISTGDESEAALNFQNKAEVLLESNTIVFIDKNHQGNLQITLQAGNIKIVNEGPSGELWVISQGKVQAAKDYRPTIEELVLDLSSGDVSLPTVVEDKKETKDSKDEKKDSKETAKTQGDKLDNTTIRSVLSRNRNLFYRCYTQLLQKTKTSGIKAELSFNIQNTGETDSQKVTFSSSQDEAFRRCLVEALQRIRFPPFQGEPISTLFPIRFE